MQKVERCLMALEGLLSIAESQGAAGEELTRHQARYGAIKDKAESGDLLTALAEAEAFKPELTRLRAEVPGLG